MSQIDISYRRIARIAAPVMVTQWSYTAMGVADTIMVGHLGVLELGAVGLGNLLTWWFLSLFFGLLSGVNAFVAQAYGAGEGRRVGVVFWHGLYLALLSAVAIWMVKPLMPAVFAWSHATPEMQEIAVAYSSIRLIGGIGLTLLLMADNFYRGLGRTDVPMWCALSQLVLNCGLNYLLIFGKLGAPAMGARGAAVGTVVSQTTIGLVLLASILGSRRLREEFSLLDGWRLRPSVLRSMLGVSLPIGVQTFMEMGGVSVFTAVIAQLGAAQMAATNAVIQAWSLSFMVAFSLSVGATTLVGQCLGAGELDAARVVTARIQRIGTVMMALTSILYLGAPGWLMRRFVQGDEVGLVLPYARPLFLIVTVSLLLDLRFNVLAGALRGAGDTTYTMLVNIGSAWLVFVPLTLWATPRFGLVGAWWCLPVYILPMVALAELRYRGRRWLRRLVDEAPEPATGETSMLERAGPRALGSAASD